MKMNNYEKVGFIALFLALGMAIGGAVIWHGVKMENLPAEGWAVAVWSFSLAIAGFLVAVFGGIRK